MSAENEKKYVLRTLTPCHVGSGQSVNRTECFTTTDKRFVWMDMAKLFSAVDAEQKARLIENVLCGDEADALMKLLKDIGVPNDAINKSVKRIYSLHESFGKTKLTQVALPAESAGKVYLPGSSIKGSLLSGLAYALYGKDGEKMPQKGDEVFDDVISAASGCSAKKFGHWLSVSDAMSIESKASVYAVKQQSRNGSGSPIPTSMVCIDTDSTFALSMKRGNVAARFSSDEVLRRADAFYREVAKKSGYDQVLEDAGKAILIRVGQGSSALSTSLLLAAEKANDFSYCVRGMKNTQIRAGQLPKTHKVIPDMDTEIPLGWAVIER
jgi:CRISPR/Cas system CSM-associated protein Csm5 (group 7 of RAMP superfamily)